MQFYLRQAETYWPSVSVLAALKKRTAAQDWVLNNTKEESTFEAIAKMISQFCEYVKKEANLYGFQTLDMDIEFASKIHTALGPAAAWLNEQ